MSTPVRLDTAANRFVVEPITMLQVMNFFILRDGLVIVKLNSVMGV